MNGSPGAANWRTASVGVKGRGTAERGESALVVMYGLYGRSCFHLYTLDGRTVCEALL